MHYHDFHEWFKLFFANHSKEKTTTTTTTKTKETNKAKKNWLKVTENINSTKNTIKYS